ncbi:MAG: lipopolysaccharide biosynthesis protein [Geothrix sp.]|uniref:lipopolysaccharide biosynthesis protein n=1 Tax=Geothrix sp. TaxID=1962974 RepID=UPI0018242E36|nr:lipopolysaccharide biosynthesis protein [Geothrix sp.]NWJ41643.1 lipopolysaccharide biosynthesis protein [Geothrix sp.]WIL20374.1 MAG: lipopolysaccharide biosynthesis protein [Geothrix sp.]
MTPSPAAALFRLAKNTGLVALGTAMGHVFVLASTPFLSRLYSTDQFGELALLLSISGIVLAAGCLRYEMALPGAEERAAVPIFMLCGVIAASLAILAFCACFLPWHRWFDHPILQLIREPWLVAGLVVGTAMFQAVAAFLVREGRFAPLAALRTSQGFLYAMLAILPLFGLLWSYVLSFLAGGLVLSGWVYWKHRAQTRSSSPGMLLATARDYKRFPIYLLPGIVLDMVGLSVCVWIISAMYGLSQVGQYSQIQRLIGAPMLLISASLSQAMLKHASDEQRARRPVWPLVKNLALILGACCLALLIVMFFFGSWGLHHFLGPKWRVDTFFVCIIALPVFVRSSVSPLSTVLITTGRLRHALIWQVCFFVTSVSILPWLAAHTSFDRFLLGYAVHQCVLYLIYFLIIRHDSKVPGPSTELVSEPIE